jgi:2-polyprenyl-6-methoxyphenol hydroxylase-like FAD-dependent oxidoreductase
MPKNNPFKVVIVGASITGLALANMLEAHGLDFVVLEGHKEIAPALGASIVVQGTLARILDQLGCWEKVMEVWNRPIKVMSMTGPDGQSWSAYRGSMEQIERR